MTKLADASINSFGIAPKADAPPEESVFVSNASQLQEIISRAIQPLQDRIESLEATVIHQGEEIMALRADEKLDHDDIRDLFDALASLEQTHIQPLQKDRGEILRALIAANGGKMLAKDARVKMHLSKTRFSLLLASLKDYIETKPLHSDKRKLLLIIK
jgi:uncharacterized membrane protein